VTGGGQQQVVKNESGGGKQAGGGSAVSGNPGVTTGSNKDVKPGTPTATVSTTPSSVSSNSNDVKPMNGNGESDPLQLHGILHVLCFPRNVEAAYCTCATENVFDNITSFFYYSLKCPH
jgi:hypothetical protein